MATVNEAAIRTVLRDAILPQMQDVTIVPTYFIDKVKPSFTNVDDIGGARYRTYVKMKSGKSTGGGPRGAGQDLPVAVNPEFFHHYADLCRWYATGEYDGPIRNLKSVHTFINNITDIVTDIKWHIKYQQEASYLGDETDVIAQISSAHTTSATVTCTDSNLWPGTRRLIPNSFVDSYNGTTGYGTNTIGMDAGGYVQATDDDIVTIDTRTTFTCSQSVATSEASDYIMWPDGSGSLVDAHPMGLAAIVDGKDSQGSYAVLEDLQGGSASANPQWRSYVSDANGTKRYLDDELLEDVALGIDNNASDRKVEDGSSHMILSNPEIFLRYRKDSSRDHQWVNKTKIVAGVKVIDVMVNGTILEWVTDKMVGGYCLFILCTKDLMFKAVPLEVMDPAGWLRLTNKDTMRIQVKQYSQMMAKRRDGHAIVRDLNE